VNIAGACTALTAAARLFTGAVVNHARYADTDTARNKPILSMKLDALTSYGIFPAFIERWKEVIGERLLDWQADALTHYGLLNPPDGPTGHRNLLVIAPTSSGKTFIGELAAAAALSRRKKVIFIVPLKAIAGEKHREFEQTFGTLGFKAIISTRDHRRFDGAFSSGNFDVAVVVAEKLRHLLVKSIDLLERVDLVVADELHLLADPDRGPALASVIEKLARAEFDLRFIGLSTRLPAPDFLADFLNARIMRVCRRPVELRRGVLCDGVFRYREDNSGDIGSEQFGRPGDFDRESLLRLLSDQLSAGERILVFGKTKADCHYRADALAQLRPVQHDLSEAEKWTLAAGGPVIAGLADWYTKGIGIHHADLSFAQRRLTERLFREGKLQIIFCTGTLAMGVNLPASIVYVEAERFAGGRYGGAPFLTALERHEFDNAAGRAGRLGFATSAGRAILCAETPIESDILWQTYIAQPQTETCGTIKWPTPQRRLLEAVACGLITNPQSCAEYFIGLSEDSGGKVVDLDSQVERLAAGDLLAVDDSNTFRATPTGLVAAASGVSPESIQLLRRLVTHYSSPDPVLWTAAAMALPESADLRWPRRFTGPFDPVAAAWHEQFGDDFESTMARSFPDAFRPETWYPKPYLRRRAMAAALAVGDWATGESADTLTARHQTPLGRFEQAAETVSWLVDTAAALAEADRQNRTKAPLLWRTAFEIRRGLPYALYDLSEAIGVELPREGILSLARLGWDKPESLTNVQLHDFHEIFPEAIAEEIIRRSQRWIARNKPSSPSPTQLPVVGASSAQAEKEQTKKEAIMPQALTLDGRPMRSRFAIGLGNSTCALRAKSFKYLFVLAAARHLRCDGWIDKRDVEAGENQIKYIYQLRQELKAAYDGAQQLIENDGSGRYRLALPAEMIRFNMERITEFPDWEMQKTAEQLAALKPDFKAA